MSSRDRDQGDYDGPQTNAFSCFVAVLTMIGFGANSSGGRVRLVSVARGGRQGSLVWTMKTSNKLQDGDIGNCVMLYVGAVSLAAVKTNVKATLAVKVSGELGLQLCAAFVFPGSTGVLPIQGPPTITLISRVSIHNPTFGCATIIFHSII